MAIKQQAVHCRPVRSDFDNDVLYVSVDIRHAVEELKWKRAAVPCNVEENPVILVRRSHHIVDRCR